MFDSAVYNNTIGRPLLKYCTWLDSRSIQATEYLNEKTGSPKLPI